MPRYVFFDCETTGLPRNYKAPPSDVNNWPRVIQLAWLVADGDGTEQKAVAHVIRPDGFTIPSSATKIHGITTERAMEEGADLGPVMEQFAGALEEPGAVLIAHNVEFDLGCVGAEFHRVLSRNPLQGLPKICTMRGTTEVCRLPGPYGYKWPKLDELHFHLFREPLAEAHEALADVRACVRCFFELKERGLMHHD